LNDAYDVAEFRLTDVAVDVARQLVKLSGPDVRGPLVRLAKALYYDIKEDGPSPGLEEAEHAAVKAVELGERREAADYLLLGDILSQEGKSDQALDNYGRAASLVRHGEPEALA